VKKNVDKLLKKIQSKLNNLTDKEKSYGWKPTAKYFMLHQQYGSDIFNYMDELRIPKWIEGAVKKNDTIEKCKTCKFYRPSRMSMYESRYMTAKNTKVKYHDVGVCLGGRNEVKKEYFCINFKRKEK